MSLGLFSRSKDGKEPRIGLALGGGGAKGLAHLLALQVFDELGIRPHLITGTSIGAIIGALYAAGLSASAIEEHVREMVISSGDSFREALEKRKAFQAIKLFDLNFGSRAILKGEKFIEFFYDIIGVSDFKDLKMPLKLVATDFWTAEQVVLDEGDLLQAVRASMALPGVFLPVERDGRVLIDGGGVNPLPYDLLEDCDIKVAVDVMGCIDDPEGEAPSLFRAISGTFDIMQKSIIAAKIAHEAPDIYIKPKISNVNILEFFKLDEIYEQAEPARQELRSKLEDLLKR